MYVDPNFKTKKALKEAVKNGTKNLLNKVFIDPKLAESNRPF